LGPLANVAGNAVQAADAFFQGDDDQLNKNWKEINNSLKLYGGPAFGIEVGKLKQFEKSIHRYETSPTKSPDPEKPFGVWSSTGKLINWVSFSDLFKSLMGFEPSWVAQGSSKINVVQTAKIKYNNQVNKAMNYFVDGDYKKFDSFVTENQILIPDMATKLKSYGTPLVERIFATMPSVLKAKYYPLMYGTTQQ
jgi:hypothetical protein